MLQNPRPRSSRLLYAVAAAGGLLLVAVLSMPELDGPHARQRANEAAAVRQLRTSNAIEKKYAAAHADEGFACELLKLKAGTGEANPAHYEPLLLLMNGTLRGYRFALGNCRTNAKGVVVHYEATAVPVERGKTGFRAFCTDDSGLLWYDAEGSATKCLELRRALRE